MYISGSGPPVVICDAYPKDKKSGKKHTPAYMSTIRTGQRSFHPGGNTEVQQLQRFEGPQSYFCEDLQHIH